MIGGNVIGIVGVGGYLPDRVVTNDEVAQSLTVDAAWIEQNTGIRTRHAAAADQAASDVAAQAAWLALADAGIEPSDLSLIVLATSTPDELGPSTACRVQALLGAYNAVAFDVTAACAGWLFAADVASKYVTDGYALVVGVEVYSKFLDPANRGTTALFGDGAGATILAPATHGLAHVTLGSDGSRADYVLIPAGGSRRPATVDTVTDRSHTVRMQNRQVRDFIAERMPQLAKSTLDAAGLTPSEVDFFVPHQPNPKLIVELAADMGFDPARLVLTSTYAGNIGAASIPYSLSQASFTTGDKILLTTIGAGMTWGAGLLTWGNK